MSLARGTIVYGDDPFKGDAASRPWVVINSPTMPFHGEQYIVLTLTTKTWYEDRIPIDDADIVDGGLPDHSAVLPWAVSSLDPEHINRELAVLDEGVVDDACDALGEYLGIQS